MMISSRICVKRTAGNDDDDDDDDDSKTTPVFHHRLDFLFENLFAAAQAAPASLFDRKFP